MPRSEAQKKADAKYHAKTFKSLTVNAKISEYNEIDKYCNEHGISKSRFMLNAAKYCMEHDIKFSESE